MERTETRFKVGLAILILILVPTVIIGSRMWKSWVKHHPSLTIKPNSTDSANGSTDETPITDKLIKSYPLLIEEQRKQTYPGSTLTFEETLPSGSNYNRYLVSYRSEGLKIYAYMTVPQGAKPKTGWPVVIFNHGYIPPDVYRSTERYIAYTDAFSRNGYIMFRSDYRGHGDSEGVARGGYSRPDYTVDVLNGMASVLKYKDADANRVGMWGHSMGGYVTLRSMVINKNIKAGVIWGGVVAPYKDILYNWRRGPGYASPTEPPSGTPSPSGGAGSWRRLLLAEFGTPEENPTFWDGISANSYVKDISGPVQLHHSTLDESVPFEFSDTLNKELKDAGKSVEYFKYEGDDHDISANFGIAMQRSVEFMDKYVKGE